MTWWVMEADLGDQPGRAENSDWKWPLLLQRGPLGCQNGSQWAFGVMVGRMDGCIDPLGLWAAQPPTVFCTSHWRGTAPALRGNYSLPPAMCTPVSFVLFCLLSSKPLTSFPAFVWFPSPFTWSSQTCLLAKTRPLSPAWSTGSYSHCSTWMPPHSLIRPILFFRRPSFSEVFALWDF